ncbi:YIP1 family protein [Paenibacillus sp. PAMC21692]|uniref:YIP1 family protein n=1 Tax=Paenibacillus sp. PAMC21692 TaxID=2762320 RepID=UPI00164D0B2F|nr:YIP1 family protein [Paenibacillus sp. PAMC21692]QNK59516.1 YIP1 family protein [Paenibacillus sp. PAMC21692]
MRRLWGKQALLLMALVILAIMQPAEEVKAKVPYPNYVLSPDGLFLPVPAPYVPDSMILLDDKPEGAFKKPQDLFIDKNNRLYIADTGNNRIVMMDVQGNILRTYGTDESLTKETGKLNEPRGVFVGDDGTLFVADTGNKRLAEFDPNGTFVRSFEQPDSELLGADFVYQPVKVVMDSRGFFYVVSQGTQKGLMMLDPEGKFRGFFGANKVQISFVDALVHTFYSKDQRKGKVVNLPYSFNNVALSPNGFIYTTTTGQSSKQVRKLNAVGGDIFPNDSRDFSDKSFHYGTLIQNFVDVAIDRRSNMTIIDKQYGRMYQYDEMGRMLYAFGSNGSGYGMTSAPVALEVDEQGNLYVLDEVRNLIQTFSPTPFANLVHEANELYVQGKYTESFEPWKRVRQVDSFYELALQAMGHSKLRQEEYTAAMEYFKAAYDKSGYSDAYYEARRIIAREHFGTIATTSVIVMVLVYLLYKWNARRWRVRPDSKPLVRMPRLIKRMFFVMMHPVQGFEALRYEGKGRLSDAFIIIGAYLVVSVLGYLIPSFMYEPMPLQSVNWQTVIRNALLPWVLWSVVNYGITSISSGEGRIRDVFIGTAYCFTPFVFFTVPLLLLTHVLSLNEMKFYDLFQQVMLLWTILLIFIKVRETHSYDTGKAIGVTLATAIGCVIVITLYIVLYGMAINLADFAQQIVKEVSYIGA